MHPPFRKAVFMGSVMFLSAIMSSCGASYGSTPGLPSGEYIWGYGNRLQQWKSPEDDAKLLTVLRRGTQIGSLTKVDSDRFIYSAYDYASAESAYTAKSYLWLFDLSVNQATKLGLGIAPTYVASRHKLFFYADSANHKEVHLFMADFDGSAITNVKDIQGGQFFAPSPVIQVSPNEVVLDYEVLQAPNEVLKYNIDTAKWTTLPIVGCSPVLWRSATQQLLCTKGDSFDYYLTDLNGGHVEKLGHWHPVVFSAYIPELDAAFALRPGAFLPPERDDTWIFYFKTKQWKRVIKGDGAAPGEAIWISHP